MAGDPVLPCLKEAAWGVGGHSVSRLLWDGEQSEHMPWVGFGYDHPHTFEFIPRGRLEQLGMTEAAIEQEALSNLKRRTASWQPVESGLDSGQTLRVLACGDDFLSAERILDADFMREAQAQMGARGLLVGIPRRGLLLAMDGEQGVEAVTPFATMVATQYHEGESAPISPLVFGMKDGEIVGLVTAAISAGRAAAEQEEEDDDAPYLTTMVVRGEDEKERIEICTGGEDFESLARGVVSALADALMRHGARPAFGGHVRLVILGFTPEPVRRQLPRLEAHLKGILAETRVVGGRPLRLTVVEKPPGVMWVDGAKEPPSAPKPGTLVVKPSPGGRECPRCHVVSPAGAEDCDCGFAFVSGAMWNTGAGPRLSGRELYLAAAAYRLLIALVLGQIVFGVTSRVVTHVAIQGAPVEAAFLVAVVSLVGTIVLGTGAAVQAYWVADRMKLGMPWLWATVLFVPCGNLLALAVLNGRAAAWCRERGIEVGLLGPRREVLHRLLPNPES